jgi:RNA polymerase sigma-70 factor (ECF subfamily)
MAGLPRPDPAPAGDRFESTRWSIIARARLGATPEAQAALAELCRIYWYPLYAYVRRRAASADEAEDLTQEFFARLLEGDFLRDVDPARGRFRAFLLACCRHFLANEWDRRTTRKRGGGRPVLSLDFPSAEERYRQEPADLQTPEKLFERRWALTVLEAALDQLGREYRAADKGALFDRLRCALLAEPGAAEYAVIGRELGMSEAAVKKAAQRLRQRFREVLCRHVAATVEDPDHTEDEIRDLLAALAR